MKITDQNRIALRGVKYASFASQETYCFQATVLFDGAPLCSVSNEGHGGCDTVLPLKGENFERLAERMAPVKAFIDSLEPDTIEGSDVVLPATLELVVAELMSAWLVERDFERALKTKWLYTRDDNGACLVYYVPKAKVGNPTLWAQSYEQHHKQKPRFLHDMPRAEALRIYREGAR